MKLFASMNELTREQRNLSDYVTCCSALGLSVVMAVVGTMAPAQAQRMGGGGYNLPSRPTPVQPVPQPIPAPQYQPQAPTYQPPAPAPYVPYGTFRPYGPLPEGRVNVQLDGSFEQASIFGYNIWVQDNGPEGNDQMVIDGPAGRESVWINCWVTEEWKSFGPNSEEFIHGVVTTYCDWT